MTAGTRSVQLQLLGWVGEREGREVGRCVAGCRLLGKFPSRRHAPIRGMRPARVCASFSRRRLLFASALPARAMHVAWGRHGPQFSMWPGFVPAPRLFPVRPLVGNACPFLEWTTPFSCKTSTAQPTNSQRVPRSSTVPNVPSVLPSLGERHPCQHPSPSPAPSNSNCSSSPPGTPRRRAEPKNEHPPPRTPALRGMPLPSLCINPSQQHLAAAHAAQRQRRRTW